VETISTGSLSTDALAAADDAAAQLRNFASEFAVEDAPLAATFLRAESAASAAIAGLEADARQTGLAALGLNAPADARAAASVLAATTLAFGAGVDSAAAVHDLIDPGGDDAVPPPVLAADDLASIALAHARLAAGRPFFLGNARTARALLPAQLRAAGLSGDVPFPMSAGLLADVEGYRAAVAQFGAGDGDAIVLVFARAAERAIGNARELATALAITLDEWEAAMVGVRSHASSRDLVAVVLQQPAIDARVTVPALGVTLAAAYTSIETLVERGILVSRGPERRNRAWFAPAILDAVDGFVERARG
jgi:hypothetical protein